MISSCVCVCNQSQVCGMLGIGVRKGVGQYSGECSLWWCGGDITEASFVNNAPISLSKNGGAWNKINDFNNDFKERYTI